MVKTSVKVTLAKLCRERLGLRAELGVIILILINLHHPGCHDAELEQALAHSLSKFCSSSVTLTVSTFT